VEPSTWLDRIDLSDPGVRAPSDVGIVAQVEAFAFFVGFEEAEDEPVGQLAWCRWIEDLILGDGGASVVLGAGVEDDRIPAVAALEEFGPSSRKQIGSADCLVEPCSEARDLPIAVDWEIQIGSVHQCSEMPIAGGIVLPSTLQFDANGIREDIVPTTAF